MRDVTIMKQLCVEALSELKDEQLAEGLEGLKRFVNLFKNDFKSCADAYFLEFVGQLDVNLYKLDSSGNNFRELSKTYIKRVNQTNVDTETIWEIVSSLIWELCAFCTDEICPQCKSDNLKEVQNLDSEIYEVCDTCFYAESNGIAVLMPMELLPVLKRHRF
ncbi:hypothetical protein PWEIH_14936 [Listeria weihenstephanensis FSL R9-0317]|uniref:Uncharacterized protein n=1 Tax=Listeria weihenstephanensis TaxID=1006155 RepID=A0A1S7FVW8_9LIST|nr:hypothetical protein [Listeria weihenstephanensis]AQY51487.1 hypothetical protein UE46_10870 [Listeria weihenstephanensis]EUJ35849.1 hypothetical protein PWEIH_14936 [Listeria weihenstephanensis FSL R9-0317]